MAGVVAASAASEDPNGKAPSVEYLAAIERFKFLSIVRPGSTLTLRAELGRLASGLRHARVMAAVGAEPVAEGTLVITEKGGA